MNAQSEEKYNRRRLRGSYLTVVLSVSLVLFTLGLQLLVMLYADKVVKQFQEDIGFTIYLQDDLKSEELARLEKAISVSPYTRVATTISKEEAVELLKTDLGEDFLNYLDYNPLTASIEVKVNAAYANIDSLAVIKTSLLQSLKIKEVTYEELLIRDMQEMVRKASFLALGFAGLLLIVAIALINNSIRLAIYSKRFLIKTMMLVGATQSFIRKPFVTRGVLQGILSACIANGLIVGVLLYAKRLMPNLVEVRDLELLTVLFAAVLLLGILISWASTALAVRKFIRTRSQNLY